MLARDTKAYKDCQELLQQVVAITQTFPRLTRYTIGQKAIDACIEMLTCIQMANLKGGEERVVWFDEYIVYEERLRTLMICGIDKNVERVNLKRIAEYTRLLVSVGKQLAGWRKATRAT